MKTPNVYLADAGNAAGVYQTVSTARTDILDQQWDVNVDGDDVTAVAVTLQANAAEGLNTRADTDLAYASPADVPFGLTRYYTSGRPAAGAFGFGWEETPFRLNFTRPEFYSSPRSSFTFLNGLVTTMW